MKTFLTMTILVLFALVVKIWPDTTQIPPNRGAVGSAILFSGPNTNGVHLEAIRSSGPPELPTNTVMRARLKWIHDDYYELQQMEPTDIIFSPNELVIIKTKGGWRLTAKQKP